MLVITSESSGYENRIAALNEEIKQLRAQLAEKEGIVSRLRVEIVETSERQQKTLASVLVLVRYGTIEIQMLLSINNN